MKIKEFLKEKLPYFMLGFIVAGITGVYAASTILGSTVLYDSSKGYTSEETVTGALDKLYEKAMEKGVVPTPLAYYLKNKVYGTENSYLYHHLNNANGYSEQSISGWAEQNANDGGYRYSGPDANVNNYICFGTTDLTTCKTDTSNNGSSKYLYRIIGVFGDNVKIIMANKLYNTKGSNTIFYWGNESSSVWSEAGLKQWLNGEPLISEMSDYYPDTTFMSLYDTNGSTIWQDKIATYNWVVGGNDDDYIKVKTFYDAEESGKCYNTSTSTPNTGVCNPVSGKVGLMRFSDYGYAASPSYWNTTDLYSYNNIKSYNWLFSGIYEFTISPYTLFRLYVYEISSDGMPNPTSAYNSAVRPSMYLSSTTQYKSGDGSSSNPYIIG